MKIDNLLDVITYSIISYYSLIRKFETTSILISGIRYCIRQMWNKYMSDIEAEEDIDFIGVLSGTDSVLLSTNDPNLYKNITYVIISYFDRNGLINNGYGILEIFQSNYLPGMIITHSQISNMMEFYLNQ